MPTNGNGTHEYDTDPVDPHDPLGDSWNVDDFDDWDDSDHQVSGNITDDASDEAGNSCHTAGERPRKLSAGGFTLHRHAFMALAAAVAGSLAWILYWVWRNFEQPILSATFGGLFAAATWYFLRDQLKFRDERNARPSKPVSFRGNHIGEGLERHLYTLAVDTATGEEENIIDFAARPPLYQRVIYPGLPVVLLIVLIWGGFHFPGARELAGRLVSHDLTTALTAWCGLVIVLVVAALWMIGSILEETTGKLESIPKEEEDKHRIKPWHVRLLVAIGVLAVWSLYRWPFGLWLWHIVQSDPYNTCWVLAVPVALWTWLRIEYSIGSYQEVTNLHLIMGSTGILFRSNPRITMDRADMTNAQIDASRLGSIFGFYVLSREGKGQADRKFRRFRCKYGPEMMKALGG